MSRKGALPPALPSFIRVLILFSLLRQLNVDRPERPVVQPDLQGPGPLAEAVDRRVIWVCVPELGRQVEDVLVVGSAGEAEEIPGGRGRGRNRLVDPWIRLIVTLFHVHL